MSPFTVCEIHTSYTSKDAMFFSSTCLTPVLPPVPTAVNQCYPLSVTGCCQCTDTCYTARALQLSVSVARCLSPVVVNAPTPVLPPVPYSCQSVLPTVCHRLLSMHRHLFYCPCSTAVNQCYQLSVTGCCQCTATCLCHFHGSFRHACLCCTNVSLCPNIVSQYLISVSVSCMSSDVLWMSVCCAIDI